MKQLSRTVRASLSGQPLASFKDRQAIREAAAIVEARRPPERFCHELEPPRTVSAKALLGLTIIACRGDLRLWRAAVTRPPQSRPPLLAFPNAPPAVTTRDRCLSSSEGRPHATSTCRPARLQSTPRGYHDDPFPSSMAGPCQRNHAGAGFDDAAMRLGP
jgi:hypothetical protein